MTPAGLWGCLCRGQQAGRRDAAGAHEWSGRCAGVGARRGTARSPPGQRRHRGQDRGDPGIEDGGRAAAAAAARRRQD